MLLMMVHDSELDVEAAFWLPWTAPAGLITGTEVRGLSAHAAPATTNPPRTAPNARVLTFLQLRIPSPPDKIEAPPRRGARWRARRPPARRRNQRRGYREASLS